MGFLDPTNLCASAIPALDPVEGAEFQTDCLCVEVKHLDREVLNPG